MEVALLSSTKNPLKILWTAARTCYSPLSPIELYDECPTESEMLRLVNHIISNKHLSVLEHFSFTFAVKNVSRTLLAQFSRHRIGVSLSVQSQRYVSELSGKNEIGIFDYVEPDSINHLEEVKRVYQEFMQHAQAVYDQLISCGIKKEDARFVLPGAAGTNLVTTFNLRSFLDVYDKRCLIPGAQWEIRAMLSKMADLLIEQEGWLRPYFKTVP